VVAATYSTDNQRQQAKAQESGIEVVTHRPTQARSVWGNGHDQAVRPERIQGVSHRV
jgi:hypothetical protein